MSPQATKQLTHSEPTLILSTMIMFRPTRPSPIPVLAGTAKRAYQKTTQESTHPTTMKLTMLNLLTTNLIVITAINQTTN